MHAFLAILEREKQTLEERAFVLRLARVGRATLLPASLLLGAAWWTGTWTLLLAGVAAPLAAVIWLRRGRPRLSLAEAARAVDTAQHLNELLTTAHEFAPREQESPVLAELMTEADRRVQGVASAPPGPWERLEPIILIALFLALLLLNLWRPADKSAAAIRAVQEAVKDFQGDSRERRELERAVQALQNARSTDERQQAADRLQASVRGADPSQDLRQAGEALAQSSVTQGVGLPLSRGETGQAAKAAATLATQLGAGLPPTQTESLRQALDNAQARLNHGATQDLRASLQEMRNNLDNSERLQQAAQQVAKELERLARRQESLQRINQRLTDLPPPSSSSTPTSQTGSDGQTGPSGPSGGASPLDRPAGEGQNPGERSGSGTDQGSKRGQGRAPGTGTTATTGAGQRTGQGKGTGGGPQTGQVPWQPPPGQAKGPTPGTTSGAGGKQAGGQVTQDPQKIVKEGKGQKPPPGRVLDFNGQTEQATSPQWLADYDKGAQLTEDERRRWQAGQETAARSREIDEFCQRHRAAPRLRRFLRDFYALPASPPNPPGRGQDEGAARPTPTPRR